MTNVFGKGGKQFFTNFQTVDKGVKIICNSMFCEMTTAEKFGSFDVWYDEGAIANILSLQQVADKYPVNFKMETKGVDLSSPQRWGS